MDSDSEGLSHQHMIDSNSDLRLPSMPTPSIDHLLTASRQLQLQPSTSAMSSVADDSSIADSVSSIGQEEWEKVVPDDGSDASDDELTRIPTPPADPRHMQESSLIFPALDSAPLRETGLEEDEPVQVERPADLYEEPQKELDIDGTDVHDMGSSQSRIDFPEEFSFSSQAGGDLVFPLQPDYQPKEASSEGLPIPHVEEAFRMHVGSELLRPTQPIKLLYFGSESLQGAIEAKVGSALVSASYDSEVLYRRRRYSVLPVSWHKDSPEVQLMPDSGTRLDVETCVAAEYDAQPLGRIELVLQSGHSIFSRYESCIGGFMKTRGYQSPDLAIVLTDDNEGDDSRAAEAVLIFLERHNIPTLVLNSGSKREDDLGAKFVNTLLPHYTSTLGGPAPSDGIIIRKQPLFIDEFFRLNSLQLNRSLASAFSEKAKVDRKNLLTSWRRGRGFMPELSKYVPDAFDRVLEDKLFWVCSLLMLTLTALAMASTPLQPILEPVQPASNVPSNVASIQTVTLTAFPEVSSVASSLALTEQTSKDLIAQVPKLDKKPIHPESFEARLYGDNVVIVHPPQWFADMKRAPELSFKLSRDGKKIAHNVTRLSNKVYALSIPKEHAHGLVDVHIKAPKWAKERKIQVDLGSAWAKLFDWIRATKDLSPTKDAVFKSQLLSVISMIDLSDAFNMTRWTQTFGKNSTLYSTLTTRYEETLRAWKSSMNETREQRRAKRKERMDQRDKQLGEMKDKADKMIKDVNSKVTQWRQTHFREEQKQLMKMWLNIRGDQGDAKADKTAKRWSRKLSSKKPKSRAGKS